jgi:hypothetical protein
LRLSSENLISKFALRCDLYRYIAALQEAGKSDKFLNLLDGCAPVAHNLVTWLRNIVQDPTRRMFVAGDGGAGTNTDFTPNGFEVGALIAGYKPAVAKWGPAMRTILNDTVHSWPPTEKLMYMGRVVCSFE